MNKIKSLTPMGILSIMAGVCAIVMCMCGLLIPALFCECFAVFCSAVSQMIVATPCTEVICK